MKELYNSHFEKIEKELEKIKKALIDRNPNFVYDFCEHEAEQINYQQEFEGKTTANMEYSPYYRCKKCGLRVDEFGKAIVQRV